MKTFSFSPFFFSCSVTPWVKKVIHLLTHKEHPYVEDSNEQLPPKLSVLASFNLALFELTSLRGSLALTPNQNLFFPFVLGWRYKSQYINKDDIVASACHIINLYKLPKARMTGLYVLWLVCPLRLYIRFYWSALTWPVCQNIHPFRSSGNLVCCIITL